MNLTPLAPRDPERIRDALVRRGMGEAKAWAAAQGLAPVVLFLDDTTSHDRDAIVAASANQGVESIVGDDWVLLAGSTANLASLQRSGAKYIRQEILNEIGQCLHDFVERPDSWVMRRGKVDLSRPVVVGILNVTPDSFSDGGEFVTPESALRHAESMLAEGAAMLDVGAESTRPGRPNPVSAEQEWVRLGPVLSELAREHPGVPVSVDTVKSETARRALEAGAWAINDVSGLRFDPAIADVCANMGAGIILMHSRGSFSEMATYDHAEYEDVVAETVGELERSAETAMKRGVVREGIVLDPGFGFSKQPEQNYEILRGLESVVSRGFPVMVGPSRKRFLGAVTGKEVHERDAATAAACIAAYSEGAILFRVHAVGLVKEAMDVIGAIEGA
ncbi:MAG: dihydropteroate synthase [Gemmatimonadota bacterium]|nr:MAG: dihydropteroate synthase [Gemmatimonadota bacterium]